MASNREDEHVRDGDRLYRLREFAAAVRAYEAAAELFENPPGELCAKLARGLVELGRPQDACAWALKVVDASAGFAAWTGAAKVVERCGSEAIPRVRRTVRVGIVGTWTTNPFVPLFKLACAHLGMAVEVYEAPFNQYFNETLDPASHLYAAEPDALVLCPDHRAIGLPAFSDEPLRVVEETVNRWAAVWSTARAVRPITIVQHTFALPAIGGFGHFGAGSPGSRSSLASAINRLLATRASSEGVGIVDADSLSARYGKERWFSDRDWHLAKVAVAPSAMPMLAQHSAAVLAARLGLSRRCLVLDLDNTLWGGVIGDDGLGGLVLGEGADGEAFVDFQRAIKELAERGIVLAVCSKNEPEIAREPFRCHPEMVLKLEDIAVFAANWRPKSENLAEIARSLNLGLDALTFVDDNPYERTEVRRSLPEVDVITLPAEVTGYRRTLEEYPYFEPAGYTEEDRNRSQQYQARSRAESLRQSAGSLEDYQSSLDMEAMIGPIDDANMARVVQLINKTNQFNLTTRRRDRVELESLLREPDTVHFWVRLRDRFVDHGLIAVVIARGTGPSLEIDTFLMSCRVIGRGVEEVLRNELAERARIVGQTEVTGQYLPTDRNKLVADLLPKLGFTSRPAAEGNPPVWTLPVMSARNREVAIRIRRMDNLYSRLNMLGTETHEN